MLPPTIYPVVQTRFGYPDGNCFAACVSSITGIPLQHLDAALGSAAAENWWDLAQAWLGPTQEQMREIMRQREINRLKDRHNA